MQKTNRFIFSGGEVHVKVDENLFNDNNATIVADIHNSDDIMELLLNTDALRRVGVKDISLVMPYVPYARQDRVMNPGESLSIKVFCDLINSQNYKSVKIWDPHSDVTPALLNNCQVITQARMIRYFARTIFTGAWKNTVLVSPDSGARKKTLEVSKVTGGLTIVNADKTRDTLTGKITGTVISSHPDDWNHSVTHLITDDICDGGYTFIEVAKALKDKGVTGSIDLYVTHAIMSKGVEPFNGLIDNIFTPNCWLTPEQIEELNSKNKTQIFLLEGFKK